MGGEEASTSHQESCGCVVECEEVVPTREPFFFDVRGCLFFGLLGGGGFSILGVISVGWATFRSGRW